MVTPSFSEYDKPFNSFLKSKKLSDYHYKDIIRMLSKYMVKPIQSPEELNLLLQKSSSHLGVAVRNYLDFLAYKGLFSKDNMIKFKSVIRPINISPDLFVPTDDIVKGAYLKLKDQRFQAMFKILVFSGIRITELVELITTFEPERLIQNNVMAKYPLGYIR